MEIFKKDYSKINEFERIGYKYVKVHEDEKYLVWEIRKPGIVNYGVEVWRKRFAKNPDGSMVVRNISDEEFGKNGWYVVGKPDYVKRKLLKEFGIALF